MDARLVGEGFLAERALLTQTAQVGGKAMLDIHATAKTPVSTNDLQTMSDIGRVQR